MPPLKRIVPRAIAVFLTAIVAVGCSAEAKKSRLLSRADRYFDSGDYDKAKIEYLNVLKADPQNAAAIRRLGVIWYEQGAPLRAAPFLLKTRDLAPDDIDSRTKLGLVFLSAGQFEEARKEALAILERSPGNDAAMLLLVESSRNQQALDDAEQRVRSFDASNKAGFHLALAALALRKQDLAAATSEVKQALSLDPRSIDARLALAKLLWLSNDLENADREFKAATELAPARSPARLAYAEFKARTGAADEAKLRLKEITREAPDSLQAWRMLAQIAFVEKQFDESLTLMDNVLFRDPANIETRLLQAQVWLAKGETKRALEGLESLSNSLPKAPAIKYELARAYLQNNNLAQAAVALNQAIAAYPNYTEAILLLAEVNLRNGNAQPVIASMLDLLKARPDLVKAQLILAEAYISQGRVDDAVALFREQIKSSPQDPGLYLRLGLILRRLNKIEEARKAFEEAQRLAPENLIAVAQLVDLDIQSKNFAAAAQRVQAELKKDPQSAVAHFLEGKVYAAQNEWNRAESALVKALELNPNSSSAYGLLISVYLSSNRLPQAIAQLEAVLTRSPDDARALMLSALIYERTNDFTKAREAYERLLSKNPDFAPALNNLAYLYAERLNDLQKAYDLAQKVRGLQPDDAAIADTLGWILYKRADYQQALVLLQESARNLPDNPEIQFHLGMASYMMGRMDEARAALREAVDGAVDYPGKEQARRQLALLEEGGNKAPQLSSNELEELLKEQPNDIVAQIRLGESYEKQGAFARAAEAYEQVIKQNPNLLAVNAKLAQLNAGPLKDSEKALKFASKARALAPNEPRMVALLGSVVYKAGNFTWAYSLLQESARQLPDDAEILHQLAWAAYSLGKVSEARKTMQRALAAAPDSVQSSDAKLFLAMTAPDPEGTNLIAAKSEIDQVLKADPDYVPALMAQAGILLQRGESASAATIYIEVLRRFPDFAPAQKRLGSLYAEDPEKRDEAYDLVMKARKALPDDPELAQVLAELSYKRKEFAYAVQLLRQSSEKKPLEAKHLYYLGMSHFKANEKQQSREALQAALAAGLSDPPAAEAKSVLAELDKN